MMMRLLEWLVVVVSSVRAFTVVPSSSIGRLSCSSSRRSSVILLKDSERSPPSLHISSPVLQQVYPHLLEFYQNYGHSDIPLGTSAGRQCQTLRRLQIQDKLTPSDVALLDALQFRWHSLEDVYKTADFDALYERLLAYQKDNNSVSPPKKYPPDPELGAWVTGIRRLGVEQVDPQHVDRLNALNFEWTSSRQCGSAFMKQYRQILERIQKDEDNADIVWRDPAVQQWMVAQQEAAKRGSLNETRKHYMEQLKEDWINWKP